MRGLLNIMHKDKPLNKPYPSDLKEDFYFENGLMVFTEQYHLKRGHCCGSRCRHCPYDWKNVNNKDNDN